jgi:hypothetical protein
MRFAPMGNGSASVEDRLEVRACQRPRRGFYSARMKGEERGMRVLEIVGAQA